MSIKWSEKTPFHFAHFCHTDIFWGLWKAAMTGQPDLVQKMSMDGCLVLGGFLISTYEMTNAVNCCQGFKALNNSCQHPASHQQHLQLSVSITQISQFVTTEPHGWSKALAVIIYKRLYFFLIQVFNKELVIQHILTHNWSDNYAMCIQKQKWKWALRQLHAFQLWVPLQIILSKERSATTLQVN